MDAMNGCLADQTIVDLVENRIDGEPRALAETHIEGCDACRRLLAATVLSLSSSTPDPSAHPARQRGACIGRYVLIEAIGAGSMGVVYSAFDPELHREVALKLVRTHEEPEERNARVLREARAMAKLSHPNVITVYDVGPFQDEVFVAMELVRGSTLRAWLARTPRDAPTIVAMFVQAGRGLAAAHEVGIVHRDFKPDNVLVGDDGRVRVTDFGLARLQASVSPKDAGADAGRAPQASAVAGTPAYMAPEQAQGRADAASDQYAFSVALYEALYAERPFANDPSARTKDPPFPAARKVPARVRHALARGLRLSPAERYGSMKELLAELEVSASKRSTSLAIAVAIGAVILGVSFAARSRPAAARPSCSGADEKLAGVWDDARRDAVSRALHASGKPFADDTWRTVETTLDTYSVHWKAERTDACEATRIRGEQSEAILDKRMVCLDRRLIELRALGDVLSHASPGVLEKAAQSTLGLTPLSTCSPLALSQGVSSPLDAEVSRGLAEAKALRETGQYDDAERLAQTALERARSVKQPQAVAELLNELGEVSFQRADGPLSEQRFFDALEGAERLGHNALVAHTEMRLGWATGVFQSRPADADRWLRLADSTLEHLGDEADEDRARVSIGRSYTRWNEHQTAAAAEEARRALQFTEDRVPDNWDLVASARSALGAAVGDLDEPQEAERLYRLVLSKCEQELGPTHPKVAATLDNLAIAAIDQGRYAEALAYGERSVAIAAASGLPANTVIDAWQIVADALARMGRFAEAHTAMEKSMAVARTSETQRVMHLTANEGNLERLEGHNADALVHLKLALEMMNRSLGPHDPESVGPACDLGILYFDQGKPLLAIRQLEDALSLPPSREFCLAGNFALAQSLWATGRDRPRARALVKEERAYFRAHPGRASEVRDRDLWFQKHAPELANEL